MVTHTFSFDTWEGKYISMTSRLTDPPTEFQTLSHTEKRICGVDICNPSIGKVKIGVPVYVVSSRPVKDSYFKRKDS